MRRLTHFHIHEKEEKDEKIEHYDVCIVGGGPAGLSAAIYSSRYGLHTGLVTKDIGGMANLAHKIENYPGFEGSGVELMQKFYKQAEKYGTELLNSEVADLYKDKTGFVIELKNGKVIHSRTIIIALGTEKRKLKIKGEEELLGKGVSYCANCDGVFFKGKIVGVIGGRNSAAEAALILSNLSKKVYIIYRGEKLNADKAEVDKIKKKNNIELVFNSVPIEIKGKERVEKILIEQDKKKKEIRLDGVFIEIGAVPSSFIAKRLGIIIDEDNYIVVDEGMETSVNGVFAAGDLVKSRLKQVVVAASQGAVAAKSAYDYLQK